MNLQLHTAAIRDASPPSRASHGWRSGQVLAQVYRLEECIGHGGMGEVYAAEHLRLGRRVAVKILHLDCPQKGVRRFRREARANAQVVSEYVVSVLDCGELEDQTPYLVMELLEGQDLRHLLDAAGPLAVRRAVRLVWEACQGLAAVHDSGLIHRDLKPENLFVTRRETGEDWCKVLDFGVAKQASSSSTVEGAVIGTVRYMAPEQLQDASAVSARSDIYSMGAILYECLSGSSPHSGNSPHELMFKIMNSEAPSVLQLRPELLPDLAAVIASCLARTPERRFGTAKALAAALAPFCQRGSTPLSSDSLPTERSEPLTPARRSSVRRSAFVFLGAGLVAGSALSELPRLLPPRRAQLASAAPPDPGGSLASRLRVSADAAPAPLLVSHWVQADTTSSVALPAASPPRAVRAASEKLGLPAGPSRRATAATTTQLGTSGAAPSLVLSRSVHFDPSNPYSAE